MREDEMDDLKLGTQDPDEGDYDDDIKEQEAKEKTLWHRLLQKLFELLLTPVGLTVQAEPAVMSDVPKTDILVIRRDAPFWTQTQLERLPDGIRDSTASHILIEFKATEAFNELALQQALSYDYFYRQSQKSLKYEKIQTFVISAQTPQRKTLEAADYQPTDKRGVYESEHFVFRHIKLIVLNQLVPEGHNAFVKCFASVRKEHGQAFVFLRQMSLSWVKGDLLQLLNILYATLTKGFFVDMSHLSVEQMMELSKDLEDFWLKDLLLKRVTEKFELRDLLSQYQPENVLAQYELGEILAQYQPEEVLAQYQPEEVLAQYQPEEVLAQYQPEEVLAQYQPEEIMAKSPAMQEAMAAKEREAFLLSQRDALLSLLQHHFGALPPSITQTIEATTDLDQLKHWLKQTLDAQTLADMDIPTTASSE